MLYKLKVFSNGKLLDVKRVFASGKRLAIKKYFRNNFFKFNDKLQIELISEESASVDKYVILKIEDSPKIKLKILKLKKRGN